MPAFHLFHAVGGIPDGPFVPGQLLLPSGTSAFQCPALMVQPVLLQLHGIRLLLLLIDTAVDFRELPLTEFQFLHAGLDVELRFCHQKLMPAERTGDGAGQFVREAVNTGRNDTPFMTQFLDAAGQVAQTDVDFPQPLRSRIGLIPVCLTECGILLLELFPAVSPVFQFLFRLLQDGIAILQPLCGGLQPSFLFGNDLVPVRLPGIGKEGHHFRYLFQTRFQCGISGFQFLQSLVRPLHSGKLFLKPVHGLVPGTDLLPLGRYGRFQSRDTFHTGTSPLGSGFLLLAYLLLQHPDTAVQPGQFQFHLPFLFRERYDVFLHFGDGFIHQDTVGKAVDDLFLLLVR